MPERAIKKSKCSVCFVYVSSRYTDSKAITTFKKKKRFVPIEGPYNSEKKDNYN